MGRRNLKSGSVVYCLFLRFWHCAAQPISAMVTSRQVNPPKACPPALAVCCRGGGAGFFTYFISQEFPQFWQRQIFWFFTTVFSPPLLFFHTRLDMPRVDTAIKPRAALLIWPPIPFPCFLVLLDTCSIEIVTFSLPQFGHIMINCLPSVIVFSTEQNVIIDI